MFFTSIRHVCHYMTGLIFKQRHTPDGMLVVFRYWPVDMDLNMHLNNAAFFTVADMAICRWLPKSDIIPREGFMRKYILILKEQNISYQKSIQPFQQYEVLTNVSVQDDKWIIVKQEFRQFSNCGNGSLNKYASLERKFVVKEVAKSGLVDFSLKAWQEKNQQS